MDSRELRNKFIGFFKEKGHFVLPSASLVPENDPTVLFTTAGMHPLVPYLIGEKHPAGKRLTNVQKCIRTGDIDEVGDKTHCTFFEMLGYWSLGDYFKKDAIEYIFEFLTKVLKIDPKNLAVTCFEGDPSSGIPKDNESAAIWKALGIPEKRIAFLGYEDNWWGPAGVTGPCGPDTEMFVWTGGGVAPQKYDPKDKNWVEICNDVFMEYNKAEDGKFELLTQKNVDFGGGLERILSYLDGRDNVFETDLFELILKEIEQISGKKYSENEKDFRIIADHLKAATFMINDGVVPSNKDRGYVLRRLIRRAIVKGHQLAISENFTTKIAEKVFEIYEGVYNFNKETILSEIEKEENKFRKTLIAGLIEINSYQKHFEKNGVKVDGHELFDLYQSRGIPLEISVEELNVRKVLLADDAIDKFNIFYKDHQEKSRTASSGMFKGGLADAGEETKRLHTAAHLMLAALRKVLGDHVYQKGSNITPDRLRFDFSHPEKMTPEQIKQVEDLVNEQIQKNLSIDMTEMSVDEAKAQGAMGVFDSKYGEKVKVYTIGEFSKEICGGPHASRTGELGHFEIQKEESSSSGVRRIKAVLK